MLSKTLLKISLISILGIVVFLLSVSSSSAQVTCTAQGGLSWGNTASWDCGHVPTSVDDVIIPIGINRVVNVSSATAASLTVNGQLEMGNNNNDRTLTVGGNVTIGSTGIFRTYDGFGTNRNHTVNIGGDITNDNVFDGTPTAVGSNVFNVTLTGSSTQTISGSAVANFNDLTVNSGATADIPTTNQPTVDGTLTNNGTLVQSQSAPGSTATEFLHILDDAGSTDAYWGVTLTPDASLGSTTVSIRGNQAACTSNASDELLTRCFDIAPTNEENGTVRLYFTEAERNSLSAASLVIWHFESGWSEVGDNIQRSEGGTTCTTGGGIACYVQADNISNYSPFAGGSTNTPTAVTLQDFDASLAMWVVPIGLLFLLLGVLSVGIVWQGAWKRN